MRDLMRQLVDHLHTFTARSNEPGFLDRIGPWMDVASRWDEPKLVESFLPTPTEGHHSAMTETVVDGPGPRHAFALHPDPVKGLLHRIYVVFRNPTAGSGRPAPT